MQKYFTAQGYQCYPFNYPTRTKTISQSAQQLDTWLRKNNIPNPHMICHSMGGLVCHAYLQQYVKNQFSPSAVVCLGSPFQGSMVARKLANSPVGKLLIGVQSDSELVWGVERWHCSASLGIIAGNKNIGAGRLLGLDPNKPGDGTVLVEETGIEGATDHIILPVTHSQMTFSTTVFRQIKHFYSTNSFNHENT